MLNKNDLVQVIGKKVGVSKTTAAESLQVVLDEISKALSRGEAVILTGFGKFEVSFRKERQGRNPKTGEKITISARKVPRFKAGKILKDAVK